METRINTLTKAILEIENPYPDDNLITNYKDFLKVKDYLPYYQFNVTVFQSLLKLTIDNWDTSKRISRIKLLELIKRYSIGRIDDIFWKRENPLASLDIPTRKNLFAVFKNIFEKPQSLSQQQVSRAQQIGNFLLVNLPLTEEEKMWLCENESKLAIPVACILKYSVRSKIISRWAYIQYDRDNLRTHRAEVSSWIIDENPNFEIDKQTLIDDFEYTNLLDTAIIRANRREDYRYYSNSMSKYHSGIKLSNRSYTISFFSDLPNTIPDFTELRKYFYENIDIIWKKTMLWAVAYSRLGTKQKSELLKKYYADELHLSLFYIGKKYRLTEVLEWLKTKPFIQTNRLQEIKLTGIPDTHIDKEEIRDILTGEILEDCPF
jgi:hypothetical protein